ncbi:hypothetical protein RB653_005534 [Dictyostelium firmibasis]|uniref:C2 domain-containing protein n=1 Tax=Dictyostelium firmibasis TaxID=79012 RepID=A0AAN7U1H3_9MYCE
MSTTATSTSTTSNHCGGICTNNSLHHMINNINNNQFCSNKLNSEGIKIITITVVGARNLRKKQGGKIDPYVEVKYKDKIETTKKLRNTTDPMWNDEFKIEIKESDRFLKPQPNIIFYVWDNEMFIKNNEIGFATVSLETIAKENVFENWIDLNGSFGMVGQIHIRATITTPDDIEYNMDEWFNLESITKGGSSGSSSNSNSSNSSSKTSPSSSYRDETNINQILDSQKKLLSLVTNSLNNNFNNNNNNNNINNSIKNNSFTYNPFQTTTTSTTTTSSSSCKSSGQSNVFYENNNNNNNNNNNFSSLIYQQQQYQSNFGLNGSIDPEVLRMILSEREEEESNRDQDMLSHCIICKKNFEAQPENLFLMDDCLHNFCKSCLKNGILYQIQMGGVQIHCVYEDCSDKIQDAMLRMVLDNSEYQLLLKKQLEKVLHNNKNFIHCPNCQEVFERIQQPPLSPPLISSANTTATTSASTSPLPQSLSNSLSNSSFASITSLLSTSSNSNYSSNSNNTTTTTTTTSTTSTTQKKRNKLNLLSPDGSVMTEETARHREEFRFRCTKCTTEFCSDCNTSPYHYSFTCEKYTEYLASRKCRFCLSSIRAAMGINAKQREICDSEECQQKLNTCCDKILPCGHHCIGVKGEKKCEPCFDVDCVPKDHFNNDEYCNICYVESIKSAPSVMLDCGHMFHYGCIEKQLTSKTGPRITFHHSDCPLCKKQMKPHPAINHILEPILKNKAIIQSKAMERLSYEGLAKCKEIEDKKSKWYQDPENYSMDRYVYYSCFKCKGYYFAGQARCDEGVEGGYKEEDLVCGSCRGSDGKECKVHGWDYIIWKCQFCCSVAQWYCWNKVHFCSDCHTKQQKGDYLNKKPKTSITQCEGPDKCPLKVEHPHVEEFILGCNLCKNLKEF